MRKGFSFMTAYIGKGKVHHKMTNFPLLVLNKS